MKRKSGNTTLRIDLYSEIQKLALKVSAKAKTKINANDLIEEGMEIVITKYKKQNNKPQTVSSETIQRYIQNQFRGGYLMMDKKWLKSIIYAGFVLSLVLVVRGVYSGGNALSLGVMYAVLSTAYGLAGICWLWADAAINRVFKGLSEIEEKHHLYGFIATSVVHTILFIVLAVIVSNHFAQIGNSVIDWLFRFSVLGLVISLLLVFLSIHTVKKLRAM